MELFASIVAAICVLCLPFLCGFLVGWIVASRRRRRDTSDEIRRFAMMYATSYIVVERAMGRISDAKADEVLKAAVEAFEVPAPRQDVGPWGPRA